MAKITKNQKVAYAKVDANKTYSLTDAAKLVKEITFTKFDASVDLNIRLGVDPRKANQMVRGMVTLPHGTGKQVRVLVLCTPDKEQEAKDNISESFLIITIIIIIILLHCEIKCEQHLNALDDRAAVVNYAGLFVHFNPPALASSWLRSASVSALDIDSRSSECEPHAKMNMSCAASSSDTAPDSAA